jgi:hypothetical protein
MFDQILANARFLAQSEVCIWFVFWAYRRKYELDGRAKVVRWSIVGVCYVLGCLPGPRFGPAKLAALVVGLAFFCWPNFAFHLTKFFRRGGAAQNSP